MTVQDSSLPAGKSARLQRNAAALAPGSVIGPAKGARQANEFALVGGSHEGPGDGPRGRGFSPGCAAGAARVRLGAGACRWSRHLVRGDRRLSAAAPFRQRRHRAVVLADRRWDASVDDVGPSRRRRTSGTPTCSRTRAAWAPTTSLMPHRRSSPSSTRPTSTRCATSRPGHSRPSPTSRISPPRTTPTARMPQTTEMQGWPGEYWYDTLGFAGWTPSHQAYSGSAADQAAAREHRSRDGAADRRVQGRGPGRHRAR